MVARCAVVMVLAIAGCAGKAVWSHAQPPSSTLSCSSDEVPTAIVESKTTTGLYAWSCERPPACKADQEVIWKRTGNSRDYDWASTYEVKGVCAPRCSDTEERSKDGGCEHRETDEEKAQGASERASFWRQQHPGAACMHDCADLARQCTVQCRSGLRSQLPACMSECQAKTDACTPRCQGLSP